MIRTKILLSFTCLLGFVGIAMANLGGANLADPYSDEFVLTSPVQDTIPLEERYGDFINDGSANPFDLEDPSIVEKTVEYDAETNRYIIIEKIGEDFYRAPSYMTFDEYVEWQAKEQEKSYFQRLAGVKGVSTSASGKLDPIGKIDVEKMLIDRLFGGTKVDIRPQGNITLDFGVDYMNDKSPNPVNVTGRQKTGGFDFGMDIQMSVEGQIGEKLKLNTSYNTQATFDFDNIMKLEFDSDAFSEDDIIKKIEAGDVSMPLRGSLIEGAQTLFGLKTELQFGRLRVTGVAAQQRSERGNIQIEGGAQVQKFRIEADLYEVNKHFFLSHYNREVYEQSLTCLPNIQSLFKIINLEVWVTNTNNTTEFNTNVIALTDLGEADAAFMTNPDDVRILENPDLDIGTLVDGEMERNVLPYDNEKYNSLFRVAQQEQRIDKVVSHLVSKGLVPGEDFEKVNARKLNPSEYNFHPQLGFISLNTTLRPDQVVGVAYEYSYQGREVKRVGQLSINAPNDEVNPEDNEDLPEQEVLIVKMLKSTTTRVDLPMWDLMMKNVYSTGAYQVNPEEFRLDVFYDEPGKGFKRFLPESNLTGVPLLEVFGLDKLNSQRDPFPDGYFDFVPGVTIIPTSGRIIFPVLEPFGTALTDRITDTVFQKKYAYQELYDSTVTQASLFGEKNRFVLMGDYKSDISDEIYLGAFNLPEGSVRVSGGGIQMIEGRDYVVDYNVGKVKILNEGVLASGAPVNVSFESNNAFGFNNKTMLGLRADYEVSKNLNIGGTYMRLFEKPFTQKVNMRDDPINNRIFGLDVNYSKDAPWITKMVDKLPLLETKAESSISFSAEGAYLLPGHSSIINLMRDTAGKTLKKGVVYIDDFEGSTTATPLGRNSETTWVLASIPQDAGKFEESELINSTDAGVNRALLNWYTINAYGSGSSLEDRNDNPYTADILQTEVFPNRQVQNFANGGAAPILRTLDLTYYPSERGPYNFDVPGGTEYSEGYDGPKLASPESRWAGVMRQLTNNDFEASNYEYLEIWLLNPFIGNGDDTETPGSSDNSGILSINLGNVSEDIMRDSRQFFESGMPADGTGYTDYTDWGQVPRQVPVSPRIFNGENRKKQDVGFDGLDNPGEQSFFQTYLNDLQTGGNTLFNAYKDDPANDDYKHFNDESYGENASIFERFKRYNNPQGNSPQKAENNTDGNRVLGFTQYPDSEDINGDVSLSETEAYFEYDVRLEPDGMGGLDMSNKYIVDEIEGDSGRVWYRVQIPLEDYDKKIGSINDFRSIRFMRMYLSGFKNPVTLRLASLELIRNQWRRYIRDTIPAYYSDYTLPPDGGIQDGTLEVNAVNIEENSSKEPFEYVLPPNVRREETPGAAAARIQQNEQSLSMEIGDLPGKFYKGIFKNIRPEMQDLRLYDCFQMFVHGEEQLDSEIENGGNDCGPLNDDDLSVFVRFGSDFEQNYYEYKIPLKVSKLPAPNDQDSLRNHVWPSANEMRFSLKLLKEAKVLRDQEFASEGDSTVRYGIQELLAKIDASSNIDRTANPNATISVRGYPNLGLVKGIMIGVVNEDDVEHCAEIWVNEMRLGFDERGGMAAVARMDIQLADFGNLSAAGSYSSVGWGSIDQKLMERSLEETFQYDVSTNLELGKFFPEDWGVKLPFYALYSNEVITPKYDAYDMDIPLREKISDADTKTDRDSIRVQSQTATEIKSFNFTNVRKESAKKKKKTMPWDVSNFSVSYAYNNTSKRDPIIEERTKEEHTGSLDYTYAIKPKFIQPFKKLIKKDKYLKLISEFNFNLLPNTVSFSTIMNRDFEKTVYRLVSRDSVEVAKGDRTYFRKQFTWGRNYVLNWDFTKALKFTYSANALSAIDEPNEELNAEGVSTNREERNTKIKENIKNLGRPKLYDQSVTLSYNLPLKKIPLLDWIDVKAQYRAGYQWTAGPLVNPKLIAEDHDCPDLGNVITNNSTRQLDGTFNFENLYNKSKYLKKINRPSKSKRRGSSKKNKKDPKDKQSMDPDKKGKKGKKKSKKKKKELEPTKLTRFVLRPLMMIRKGRAGYVETFGSEVPGINAAPNLFGLSQDWSSPGWGYVLGLQPNDNWFRKSINNDWITKEEKQNREVMRSYSQKIDASLTVEPFKDFKIDIEANRSYDDVDLSLFSYVKDRDYEDPNFEHRNLTKVANFSMSYFALKTLFEKDGDGLFQTFEDNRKNISKQLGINLGDDPDNPDYKWGFGSTQQDVLVPAFLATYTNRDTTNFEYLDYSPEALRKLIPRPNWRVSYNGLTKLKWFKEHFESFALNHSYRSTLNINNMRTEQQFDTDFPQVSVENQDVNPNNPDRTYNYFSRYALAGISITEGFSPLLGIDFRLKNGLEVDIQMDKKRDLRMDFGFNRLNESLSTKYSARVGYLMKDVYLAFFYGKKGKKKKKKKKKDDGKDADPEDDKRGSDLRFDLTFSYSNDDDRIHTLSSPESQPTRSRIVYALSPKISYDVNKNLTVGAYFDWNNTQSQGLSNRHIVTSKGGIEVIFTLN